MENFVIIRREKETDNLNIIQNDGFKRNFERHVDEGNVCVVHGPSGCGKSFTSRLLLENYQFVEFTSDILKSKPETTDFIERVEGTSSVWFFDDVDISQPGWKIAAEYIKNPRQIMGPVVIVTRHRDKIQSFVEGVAIEMTPPSMNELMKFKKKISKISDLKFLKFWDGSNIRNFITSLKMYTRFGFAPDKPDKFYSTTESVDELICEGGDGYKKFIGKGIEEHGHTQDLIFSNYTSDSIEECAKITESFSRADKYDNAMYAGNWDFLPYFTLEACVIPSKYIKNKVKKNEMKPGSAWTKCYNMKMRSKQLSNFISRNPGASLDFESLNYFSNILQNVTNDEFLSTVRSYDFQSCDVDLMKHISLKTELRGRRLINIKKALKQNAVP